jgi:hypothetical protein
MYTWHTLLSYFFKIQFYRYNIQIDAVEIGQEIDGVSVYADGHYAP